MVSRTWLGPREGALVLAAIAFGLLVYGYFHEQLFDLQGATVPAASLLLVLGFGLWSAAFPSETEAGAPVGPRISLIEIIIAAVVSYLYLFGLTRVGLVVTTAVALTIAVTILTRRLYLYGIIVVILAAVAIRFLFERLGGIYFPPTPLF